MHGLLPLPGGEREFTEFVARFVTSIECGFVPSKFDPAVRNSMTTITLPSRAEPLISWRIRRLLFGYCYLVPAALCMLATVVVPIFLAIKMSLYNDVLYKPQEYRFIGF